MQTILGAGGAIGTELARSLKSYTGDIRLVSRHPKKVNETDSVLAADLTDASQVSAAVEGSSICYVTIGFDFNTKVWRHAWPVLIENVVKACAEHKVKLVFFDNVYAIGGDHVRHITEESPISPCSAKGEVRALVDKHILYSAEKGNIEAIIARSPDFFSALKEKSMVMNVIYDNLAKGKPAQWFCNADVIHTAGYAPELARATAMLGNTPGAYNQIWNLPADQSPITGRGWASLFAEEMEAKDKMQVLPSFGMKLLGMFVPILREMYEMRYQYDRDFFFDCSKFSNKFGYKPMTAREAVKDTIRSIREMSSNKTA